MRVFTFCFIVALVLCLALPSLSVSYTGGIYFDDISLTNKGAVVFFDSFNSGKIVGWSHSRPLVELYQYSKEPVNYCVYMNRMQDINTSMIRMPKCPISSLQFKASVYLPANQEQWNSAHGSRDRTRIDFRTGKDEDWFYVSIDGLYRDRGYRVQLTHVNPRVQTTEPGHCGGSSVDYESSGPVIPPATWVELVFKLDPDRKTMTVTIDGRPVVSGPYDPSLVKTLSTVDLCTWMGDRQATQKPGQCISK